MLESILTDVRAMKPMVSVIVPAYNAAPWLADCLDSALGQSWPALEVIVVDDGSTDGTLAVARSRANDRLKVIVSPQRGASAARNRGVAAARGDFLQFLDADDLLGREKVERQLARLAHEPANRLATCGLVHFRDGTSPDHGEYTDDLPFAGDCDSPLEFLLRLYGRAGRAGGMIQTSQWLVPRVVAGLAGPWNENLGLDDDGEYFARVVEHSSGVRYVPYAGVFYRRHVSTSNLSGAWRLASSALRSGLNALHGKLTVLRRLGATPSDLAGLARLYCEIALTAYPRQQSIVAEAMATARALGGPDIRPLLPTPKGRAVQRILGWKLARRLQLLHS